MRKLIMAVIGIAAAATALPATASAQYGRGGGYYNGGQYGGGHYGGGNRYGRGDVGREIRECRRELRHADSRREYRRELRECRREIARAQRRGDRGYYGNRGRGHRRGW